MEIREDPFLPGHHEHQQNEINRGRQKKGGNAEPYEPIVSEFGFVPPRQKAQQRGEQAPKHARGSEDAARKQKPVALGENKQRE